MSVPSQRLPFEKTESSAEGMGQGRLAPLSSNAEPWTTSLVDASPLSYDSELSSPPPTPKERAETPRRETRPKGRGRTSSRPQPPFVCFCGKQFKRHEHMSRHKATHSDDLKYECPICRKGFRRQDVMHRHTQTHLRSTGSAPTRRKPAPKTTAASNSQRQTAALSRADRACMPCKKAKLRCNGELPCSRCACHPNRDCSYQHGHTSASPGASSLSSGLHPSPAEYGQTMALPHVLFQTFQPSQLDSNYPRIMPGPGSSGSALHPFQEPPFSSISSWSLVGPPGGEARCFARDYDNCQRAASVPQFGGGGNGFEDSLSPCCVPMQPVGLLGTNNGGGFDHIAPSSLGWTAEFWDGGSRPPAAPSLYHHNAQHSYPSASSFEPQTGLLGMSLSNLTTPSQWGSLSDVSVPSDADADVGTPSVRSISASPFFAGSSESPRVESFPPPPPPPPAYTMMCQMEAREGAPGGCSSLPSSSDTAFYHFGSAAAVAPSSSSSSSMLHATYSA